MFIALEAGDGAGKTTQAEILRDRLHMIGADVVLTREPGGTEAAEELRNVVVRGEPGKFDAETELLIFAAARRCHIQQLIRPALDRGAIVICDRYIGSTLAFQGAGAGIPRKRIEQIHRDFCHNLMPHLTLFIDIDAETSLARSISRAGNEEIRMEGQGIEFQQRVLQCYREEARSNPYWQTVDGNGTVEEVADRIFTIVRAKGISRNEFAPEAQWVRA